MLLAVLPSLAGLAALGASLLGGPSLTGFAVALGTTLAVAWGITRAGSGDRFVRELRGQMGLVLEHAPVVVWSLDQAGAYTFVRGQGLRELKLTPDELTGRNYFDLNKDREELVKHARRALSDAAFAAETPVGGRWFSTTYLPLHQRGERAGFVAVSVDITERIRAERESSAAREQAEAALAARDEFLSIASHELKTPLTSLRLRAQTIRRGLDRRDPRALAPEKVRTLVDQVEKQTGRLGRLVEDMLDMSRIRTGKLTFECGPADLGVIAAEAVAKVSPQFAAANCELSFRSAAGPLPVRADRRRIEQALNNFLTNALRYGLGKPVAVEVGEDAGQFFVRVADQGIGVAPENQRKIFNRFERAVSANEVSGLGLGLYITQQIVAVHGGEIRLRSGLGEGATFELRLPPAPAASLSAPLRATG